MIRINIVIATWNSSQYIERCLKSILELDQLCKDIAIRLLIKDNISSDETKEIVLGISAISEFEIKWLSCSDTGIYAAWNQALTSFEFFEDDYVMFLGSDDRINSKGVMELLGMLTGTHLYDCYFSDLLICDNEKERLKIYQENCYKRINWYMSIPHPTLLLKWSLIKQVGLFDESFKIAGDYDFLLRLIKSYPELSWYKLNKPLVKFSIGGVSTSPNMRKLQLKEKFKVKVKGGLFPFYYFDYYSIISYLKSVFRI